MMLTARSCALFLLSLFLVAPAGCTRQGDGRLPGHLHLRLIANPTTLDPALIVDVMGASIAAKVFNGLVRFNDRLDIVPDIASSWTISPDGRTYTFRLRKDAAFSNGRRVTAGDFRYSFERVLLPRTRAPITWVLERISGARDVIAGKTAHAAGIRVIDDHTLELRLDRPFGPFLSLLGMSTAYVVPAEEVEAAGADFGSRPVGSGPFILAEWKHGQGLTLAARKDHWEGTPRIAGIRYRVIPEDLTAVMEFETGRLDILQVPAAEYRRYATDPAWRERLIARPGLNCYYLGLNCSRPPFDSVQVRRAVTMAIDRQRILDTVFEKRGVLAKGPVPPDLWKRGGERTGGGIAYDPDEAKRIIASRGLAGARVRILVSAEPEVLDIVEVVQYYLARAGLQAEIVQLDWSAFKQAVNQGEADAFWLSWWADYPDPENFLYPLFHSANAGPAGNRSWYRDRTFDRLVEQAQATSDAAAREQLYRQAEDRVIADAPWVSMWHRSDIAVVQQWVDGFRLYPIYSIDKGMDVSIRK